MKKQTVKVKLVIEVEVDVTGSYSPPRNGSMYRSNGDPGDPPEDAMFEIDEVIWQGINIADALEKDNYDYSSIESDCLEQIDKNNENFEDYEE